VLRLIVDRLLQMIVVLVCVTALGFFLVNLLDGDVVFALLGENYSPEAAAKLTAELHLDQPIWLRYLHWVGGVLHGDLGTSLVTKQNVADAIGAALPPTVELLIGAQVVALAVALVTTALAVRFRFADRIVTFIGLVSNSIPSFVLALLLIIVFATTFHALPSIGWADPDRAGWAENIRAMVLPSVALGFSIFPEYMRVFRGEIQEQLEQEEYVTLARMKGMSPRRVLMRHVVLNSMGGLLTLIAMTTGFLIGGVVIVEEVFSIPGVGSLVFDAISNRDSVMLEGALVLIAGGVVVANLVGELVHMRVDPRVRPQAGARQRAVR
jgi:peptide/nickel transport system permease protein